ncbi:DUF1656 domain-containing protein [Entomobacter blattae]|uniref:DUF1656 domain-containing protein n=1 Tax=Entomobacter blattae TaxID=2762277 RepID=A0A7H1NQK3_9PROT|nr:DUF1656 domain-containing protein [Entomobacter blattae]QNT78063.1 hypothetical protein JGUZn3_08300 [Entomobacter blattae]
MSGVIDINGVLISSFVYNALLSLVAIVLIRPVLTRLKIHTLFWNLPLAEFALLICFLALFTLLF